MVIQVDRVTFTGPDDITGVEVLLDLTSRYPKAEVGLPLCPERGGKLGYPSVHFIRYFAEKARELSANGGPVVQASLHVRKEWVDDLSRNIVQGIPKELLEMRHADGSPVFARVQLNLGNPDEVDPEALKALFDEQSDHRFILPLNSETEALCEALLETKTRFDIIFDKSGGCGIKPDHWPSMISDRFCIYAGGLNPENVREELAEIAEVAEGAIGIDAETGLKMFGSFDPLKTEAYIKAALEYEG